MSSAQGGAAIARETPAPDPQQVIPSEQPAAQPSLDSPRPTVDAMAGPADREVARRAYELYLARGGAHGFDMEDWIQAESELRSPPPDTRVG